MFHSRSRNLTHDIACGHAGVVEFGCKVLSCSEEPQEEQEQPPGGNVGSSITNTAAPFELQISYRSSRGAAAAAAATSSTSPGACGQGTAAASAGADAAAAVVAVARARHVIGADGYFSRVRRTVRRLPDVFRCPNCAILHCVVHVLRP